MLAFDNHFCHALGLRFLAGRLEKWVSNNLWTRKSPYTIIVIVIFVTETSEMNLLHCCGIDLAYTK
jgi:hypothetical protein